MHEVDVEVRELEGGIVMEKEVTILVATTELSLNNG